MTELNYVLCALRGSNIVHCRIFDTDAEAYQEGIRILMADTKIDTCEITLDDKLIEVITRENI